MSCFLIPDLSKMCNRPGSTEEGLPQSPPNWTLTGSHQFNNAWLRSPLTIPSQETHISTRSLNSQRHFKGRLTCSMKFHLGDCYQNTKSTFLFNINKECRSALETLLFLGSLPTHQLFLLTTPTSSLHPVSTSSLACQSIHQRTYSPGNTLVSCLFPTKYYSLPSTNCQLLT